MFLLLFFVMSMGKEGYEELRSTGSSGVPDDKEVGDIVRNRGNGYFEILERYMGLEGTIVIWVYECTSRRCPLEGAPLFGRSNYSVAYGNLPIFIKL